MIKPILGSIAIFSLLAVLTGCESKDSSNSGTTTATTTGVFVDSPVEGLSYLCSSGVNGLTNNLGQFTCNTGDTVSFSLGGYSIGSCTIGDIVSPYTLYPDNGDASLNVAQLLQTIDADNDPSNGITIPNGYATLDNVSVSPTDASFDADIQSAIPETLVTEESAINHLNKTLGLPSVVDGFTEDWIEGKILYSVILDTEDDDNDGSTTDWMLIAAKYENGNRSLDFSADGTFEVTTGIAFEIVNGVLTITEGGDWEEETITAVDATKITTSLAVSWGDPDRTHYEFFTKADAKAYMDELNAPSVANGFTADWIEGKTLYSVILDDQDDDNDGSTTDWMLIAVKYENGNGSFDFSADGVFEVTTGVTFEIINGVLKITEGGDWEEETITAVDATKITTSLAVSWGDPDRTHYEFFTKADAEGYLAELNAPSVANGFTADWIEGKTLYSVILDTQDDDNDGSTIDWMLIAAKYENGNRSLDFSADGTFEVTTGIAFEIVNGVLTITESGDWEKETITAVDATKITVNLAVSWGDPDSTYLEFFTKADAEAYMNTL